MKKLSKKVLSKSFWRWFYGNLTCFSHEHMQTFGYMWSMLPIVQELYDSKEMINGIRAGLMGPLAGIGDSLIVGTYIPVLLGIALGLSEGGSLIGPLFYIIVWNITSILFQKWIYGKGYELGGSAVEVIVGEQAKKGISPIKIMLLMVVIAVAGVLVGFFDPGLSY